MPQRAAPSRDEWIVLAGATALLVITGAWWALAFWPVAESPAWLERTRYVCFGVNESGLPDAGGWIGLIAGPLGMLAILAIGWWNGVRGLVGRTRDSWTWRTVLLTLAAGCGAILIGAAVRVEQVLSVAGPAAGMADDVAAMHQRLDRAAPPLRLLAHDGTVRSLAELRGTPVLVTFAYAHCETVCPLVVQHAAQARAMAERDGIASALLIVTLDPWRDTPSRLPFMAETWGLTGRAWVLGGAVEDVETALDAWNVPRARNTATGELTHPSLVYVIDAAGRMAYATSGGVATLTSLLGQL